MLMKEASSSTGTFQLKCAGKNTVRCLWTTESPSHDLFFWSSHVNWHDKHKTVSNSSSSVRSHINNDRVLSLVKKRYLWKFMITYDLSSTRKAHCRLLKRSRLIGYLRIRFSQRNNEQEIGPKWSKLPN